MLGPANPALRKFHAGARNLRACWRVPALAGALRMFYYHV